MSLTHDSGYPAWYHVVYKADGGMLAVHLSTPSVDEAVKGWIEALSYSSSATIMRDVKLNISEVNNDGMD